MSLAPVASQTIGQGTSTSTWTPGPAQPRLRSGALHVWRVELNLVDDRFEELLDSEERERAGRILSARSRHLWSRSRGALRVLLASYLDCEAQAVRLRPLAGGKPALREPPGGAALSFNLSHSGGLALYAFARRQVGADVQVARAPGRAPIDHVALARRLFGEEEAQRLSMLGSEEREWDFLRLWTRHEAQLKQRGNGIGGGHTRSDGRPIWIADLDLGADAAGAVAVARPCTELLLWTWAG
jgi:4'-phosphopantetheinyl transferase